MFSSVYAQELTATDTSERSVRRYQNIIKNNQQLVNFIEYTFVQRGLPKHLRNLAIIESSLDHNVTSRTGAKGVWQFMPDHANEFGLLEQERTDRYKSTKTAANSLINLYNTYKNWITVVAAYNCGQGNIQKAMNKAGSSRYTDFDQYLPAETRNHVAKYLNACYATGELQQVLQDYSGTATAPVIATNNMVVKQKIVEPKFKKNNKTENNKTTINSAYNINVIAEFLKIERSQIIKWNPNIERDLNEKGESTLSLPRELFLDFEINRNQILSESLKR